MSRHFCLRHLSRVVRYGAPICAVAAAIVWLPVSPAAFAATAAG